jgi:LacI family transcriptional regulator
VSNKIPPPPLPPAKPANNGRAANIADVAARAGVSMKTVSRVLNNSTNVSEGTRKLVREAAAALSFRPNAYARSLARRRSIMIGLLYDKPAMGSNYIAALQLGALTRCQELGYHLMVEAIDTQSPTLADQLQTLVSESSLSGVILTPPLSDLPSVIEPLGRTRTKIARIAPKDHSKTIYDIRIDDRKAAFDMTAYLIGLGHKRIGFIRGKPDHSAAELRFEGFRAALTRAGLPFVPELCAQGYFTYQSGIQAGEQLLSLKQRPTAIFTSNDDMAAAVLAVSLRFNLKIPQDLSVAGFDDSPFAQGVWPRLTTCRQPITGMGAEAVAILINPPIAGAPTERFLDHELVVRESTAPPPA